MKLWHAVTAPVRSTVRLLQIRSRAEAVLETADDAATHPALYRDARWWARFLTQVAALWAVLPIPKEIREMTWLQSLLTNYKTTLAGIAALASAASIVAHDHSKLTDPMVLGLIGAGIAGLAGKDANVTGGTKGQTEEAQTRVKE